MRKRRTKRYNLPKIDLNGIKLPKIKLPKVDLPTSRLKLPQVNMPWKQIVVVVVMVILALTMLNLNTRMGEYSRLTSERDSLSTQVGGLNATKSVLQTQVAYVGSDQAINDSAREAHMVLEGEKLLIVLTPENNVVVTPQAGEEKVFLPQPWEIWVALFFGQ
jgi:cell division protein FtsB